MSDYSKKTIASAMKWIAVIICAAIAYSYVSPQYHFTKHGGDILRANTRTGKMELLFDGEWKDMTEEMGELGFYR